MVLIAATYLEILVHAVHSANECCCCKVQVWDDNTYCHRSAQVRPVGIIQLHNGLSFSWFQYNLPLFNRVRVVEKSFRTPRAFVMMYGVVLGISVSSPSHRHPSCSVHFSSSQSTTTTELPCFVLLTTNRIISVGLCSRWCRQTFWNTKKTSLANI